MEKNRIFVAGLIGLLLAGGLILAGCNEPGDNCVGSGECTVTIQQGVNGLLIDNASTRTSCGKAATYSYESSSYVGGCKVQNNVDDRGRTHGTHKCNC